MSKYSIHFTKQDAEKAYKTIANLENKLGLTLDWKKIKRQNGDSISTLIDILNKKVGTK